MLFINCVSVYLITIMIVVVSYAARIRALSGSDYTGALFLLSLAIGFYILGYTMELNSYTSEQIEFWNLVEYIGIPFVSALWLTVSLMYCGYFRHNKKAIIAAIYAIPVITLMLRLTNSYHHLYFASVDFVEEFDRLIFVKVPGPWMRVQSAYSALSIIVSFALFFENLVKSKQRQRGKLYLLIAASAVALTGLVLQQGILRNAQLDYMALLLPITCTMVMMAISWYDFLEAISLARSKVFEASSNAILLINCQGRIMDYNKSAEVLFSGIQIQLVKENFYSVFESRPDLTKAIVKETPSTIELFIGGDRHYYNIETEKIGGQKTLHGWVKIFDDVTEMHEFNEVLRQLAMTDELSVLNNRRAFIKEGKEWIMAAEEDGHPLHIIMLDLDHFKEVNDQYGHSAGDLVIRDFSQILKKYFDQGCQVARLGGEEFAILLMRYTTEEVHNMIQVFLSEAAQHEYVCFESRFHVTVSIGMTAWQPGQALEDIMRRSDTALYQSKAQGRNCITVL
ncbi:MAG: diguanylate cyclase [Oscillospiraceae bacterium]|nr:diguanylate cyclase [Oscillospiraceae bacterium]